MIIANLSNLGWVTGQRRRNQSIFCHLLQETDAFKEGFFLQTPMVKKARAFQFSRAPELNAVLQPEEFGRPVTVLQPVLQLPDGYPAAATKRAVADLGHQLVKEFFRGRPYLLWINSITHFHAQLAEELMPGAEFRVFDSSELLMMYGRNGSKHMKQAKAILDGCDVALCSSARAMEQVDHPAKFLVTDSAESTVVQSSDAPVELPPPFPKAAGAVFIGFTGILAAEKIDFDLLCALFQRFPDYQFIFVGSTNRSTLLARLKNYANFHHIPDVPVEVLASILQQLDVAIVPELDNSHARGSDGSRVLDYLACGVPVLTTNLPEGESLGGSVQVAGSVWEFSFLLEKMVTHPQPRGIAAPTQTERGLDNWGLQKGPLKAIFAKKEGVRAH